MLKQTYIGGKMKFAAPRGKPADRHATWAFLVLQKDEGVLTQMVPHVALLQISTLPADDVD